MRLESPEMDGVKLVKTLTFKRGAYDIGVQHEVVNTGTASASTPSCTCSCCATTCRWTAATPSIPPSPARPSTPKPVNTKRWSSKTWTKARPTFEKHADNGYVAMVQHYFASAWLLADGIERENFARKVDDKLYAAGMITTPGPNRSRAKARPWRRACSSARSKKRCMESLAPGPGAGQGLRLFTILAKPLYWLLDKIHGVLGNWGWSIVGLVLLLKIAFYWLNAKAYASMAKMKALNPRMQEMRERLKDKPAADAARDDAHLPRGEGQPAWAAACPS